MANFQESKLATRRLKKFQCLMAASYRLFIIIIPSIPSHEGRLGITDDFATSFLYFSRLSTALWDHSLMLSSHLFLCLPCLLPLLTVSCKMVLVRPDERET